MAGRNKLVAYLRDLGVSDWERRQLRELGKLYNNTNAYNEIRQLNYQVLDSRQAPMELTYESIAGQIEYGGKTVKEILGEYRQQIYDYHQGSTTAINDFVTNRLDYLRNNFSYDSNVVSDKNVIDAYIDNANFREKFDTYYMEVEKYNESGDNAGAYYWYNKLISLIAKYV